MADKDILDWKEVKARWKNVPQVMRIIQEVEKLRDNERITSEANEMLRGKFMEYLRQIDSITKERDDLKAQREPNYWKNEYTALTMKADKEWIKCTGLMGEVKDLKAKLAEIRKELKEFKLAHEYCHLHGDEL